MNTDVEVLIVGAGPAGLLASIIASQIGLSHQIVEARPGLHPEPAAHVFKTHTMEVYRRIGVADELASCSTPIEEQQAIYWSESVTGLVLGRLDLTGKKGDVPRFTNISPVHSANMPQSLVEPVLHRRAMEAAGHDPVRFETRLVDFTQDEEGVIAIVEDGAGQREIRARYIIGADGAGSQVRRSAGIAMQGPQALAHFLAIHIRSDMRDVVRRRPGIIFFVRTPRLDGFFIMHRAVGSQVFMMRYDPQETPFDQYDEARCRSIIDEAMGEPREFEISSIDRWAMSAQVAERYREGRAILVGDAGHRFPPTGGLGLNTGVEDVENVIWKIAAILRGQADEDLLDSYEAECRPIALRNTGQSVFNFERMARVSRAIGAEQGDAELQAVLDALRSDPDHPRRALIQQAVDDQIDHFAFLELEMAVRLRESDALIPSAREIPLPVDEEEGYQPSFGIGSHVPHFWLAPGRSSIDALAFDRFTLFVPDNRKQEWSQACAALPPDLMPVTVVAITADMRSACAGVGDYWGDDPFAMLVRPDGRIAWIEPARFEPDGPANRLSALIEAVAIITRNHAALSNLKVG